MTVQAPPPTSNQIIHEMSDIIATIDTHAREINRRWGHNRLPHLVPIEWMEKFVRQRHKWRLACFECTGSASSEDLDRVRVQGEAMLRAFDKMEALAAEAGHSQCYPRPWEFELADGTPVTLVRERHELASLDTKGRAMQAWSLEEIADIVRRFPELNKAKEAFPGAETIQISTGRDVHDKLNDSLEGLPF